MTKHTLPPVSPELWIELPITEEWKLACRERLRVLKREDLTQERIAEHLNCGPNRISQAVHENSPQRRSTIVLPLSQVIGVDIPNTALMELIARHLGDEDPETRHLLSLLLPRLPAPIRKALISEKG